MSYIGEWVVTGEVVDSEKMYSDLSVIRQNPLEFDFSYQDAVAKAAELLDMTEHDVIFEMVLMEF